VVEKEKHPVKGEKVLEFTSLATKQESRSESYLGSALLDLIFQMKVTMLTLSVLCTY
jgi:hypothetical protein